MQLKQIEIKGFKSFADRTLIHFNSNMTGIVGPNGCGKSNTVDAIRWVLGEQKSKALRLEKMDNVLFNGTKKRPAAGRAEVSLTFENTRNLLPTEFSTVTVTRILYRSGESEYRLNDVRCRLKDISNLFSDTGISSDSYAIIELKMIDEILNDNEDSRRRLFEQAAGISKYKLRKKETMQKLNATDADLARVEDLLFEIEANLKTLEKQAKKTERYYKLREQYKELAVELSLYHLGDYALSRERLTQQQESETDRKIGLDATIASLEARTESDKTIAISRERALAAQQKEVNILIGQLRDNEARKGLLAQNIRFSGEKKQQLTQQITAAEILIESLRREVGHLEWDKNGEEKRLQNAVSDTETLRQKADTARKQHQQARSELDRLNDLHRKAELNVFDLEKQIAVQQTQLDNLHREQNNHLRQSENQTQEITQWQQQLSNCEKERQKHEQTLQGYSDEEEEIREQMALAERSIEQQRRYIADLHRQSDAKNNELKLTKSLVDSLEGFPDSIKFLQTNKDWSSQNIPLLLDLINCPDEYKASIENYLKPYLNSYIVANTADALQAINILDKHQKGKAQFLVLEDLAPNPQQADQTNPTNQANINIANATLQSALAVVSVAPEYQALLNLLLHKVYIASNNDIDALYRQLNTDIAPNTNTIEQLIIIDQAGKQMRGKGWLSGGSVGSFEGKRIGKRQQLIQLERDIAQLANTLQGQEQKIQHQQQQLSQLQKRLQATLQLAQFQRQEINKTQQQNTQLKTKIGSAQRFIDDGANHIAQIQQRIAKQNNHITQLQQQLDEARERQNSDTEAIAQAEQSFRQAQHQLTQANQAFNEQNIEYHKQQNRLNTIVQQLDFKTRQLTDTQQQQQHNQTQLAQTEQELQSTEIQQQQISDQLIAQYTKHTAEEETLRDIETAYYQIRGSLDEQEKELRRQQKTKEQCDSLLQQIHEQLNRLDLQFLSVKERLSIEFKIELNSLKDRQPNPDLNREEVESRVSKQKQQLDNYGEINPLAIEAYNEIKERYDFIVAQREDLSKAKKSLLQTIKEIETVATEQFMTAFNQARQNFIHVFRSLFTEEDQCDLLLVEPNNPLESAIDIIAKPKGKRPQSINQLSGGEKSLTALAMVFSLYLLKPAPFCILDEVDAPLDDNNVSKFTRIIRQFSSDSQFIVVTHNKNTMAAVDIIYGVTMHEEGVSRVVPVDFSTLWST